MAEDGRRRCDRRRTSSAPTVGDTAVAIGSPFGLEGSVTSGIVSALDRTLSGGANTMVGMVQTDAPINPGNSGGALVDDRGRVIGINTAILSRSGSSAGIGFAVPATTATSVADQLIEDGQVRWARLGINGQEVDARVAEAYGLTIDRGALIVRVEPGSAAHDAGLQDGDIVTAVDGEQVSSMVDLAAAIRGYQPGDQVRLTIVRDGQEVAIPVTLGTY
ncbi:MAG: PDZ domain-containing protein [Actinobacteria bacterium]|nr:PDZ domain-containing protein [Actinomycetota bacterium]